MISLRNRHFFMLDLLLLPAAVVLSFVLRLDSNQMSRYFGHVAIYIGIAVPVKLLIFYWMGLYSRMWRYASVDEMILIATSSLFGVLFSSAIVYGVAIPFDTLEGFPRSIPFIDGLLTIMVVGTPRFAVRRFYRKRLTPFDKDSKKREERRVLVVGAGDAGATFVKEMRTNPQLSLEPVGFVDDDKSKSGIRIHGIPVLGDRGILRHLVEEYDVHEVIIAMPSAPGTIIREVLRICSEMKVVARTLPSLHDIVSGHATVSQIREIEIEDLLRREPVHIDSTAVKSILNGARVLVTGAGGSIGSELCRQIAASDPSILVLVGHGENSIFDIYNELLSTNPNLSIYPVIADIRDKERTDYIIRTYKPSVIFHAAAHKHVPLMQMNLSESITNNVDGTRVLLDLSQKYDIERFVLISTDKAVNPENIMGASKRVAELLVQDVARRMDKPYVSVRFGNVLGSRGSVIPIFQKQIRSGGPVTVTDPEVKRYFMTIPEAVQLVLQAATVCTGGEVVILDMGDPIRISDLAKDLIELSGFEVGRDIEIVYTGLRPGEKLFEELFVKGEEYEPTPHKKLFILKNNLLQLKEPALFRRAVDDLINLARQGKDEEVLKKLKELVPESKLK